MGEVDWCEVFWITYQSFLRTIVEGLFCFFIVAAYVPQYIAIVSQGTFGVSSRYILFHALFSIFTLSVRVCYPIYYDAYNCVDGGPYTGWKALSSLLGMIQAVVQCLCAIVLLGLYIHYRRCDDNGVSGDQTEDVTSLPPETSPLIMGLAVGLTGLVVLSVSFTFLIMNQNEMFDPDDGPISLDVFVYRFLIHIWVFPLILANLAFLVLPVFYQVKTVQALHSHGSLSLISLGMQAFAFTVLAVLQTARGWRSILWPKLPGDFASVARFMEWFIYFYITISTGTVYNKGLSDNLVGLEWNIHGPNSGTVPGIYDVHVRIGGAVNTDLQVAQCPQGKGISCRAGLLMVHITPHGGGYFQNM
ncbi:hypothetical protein SEUCBS140593_007917 [Sporothrix eucalyptigena]|uniref:Uncharacterized protein n=1 Tax=Sporothrix eucalyptigena TaxID=1812306 RepID=A0ABP0CHW6_9PEZI